MCSQGLCFTSFRITSHRQNSFVVRSVARWVAAATGFFRLVIRCTSRSYSFWASASSKCRSAVSSGRNRIRRSLTVRTETGTQSRFFSEMYSSIACPVVSECVAKSAACNRRLSRKCSASVSELKQTERREPCSAITSRHCFLGGVGLYGPQSLTSPGSHTDHLQTIGFAGQVRPATDRFRPGEAHKTEGTVPDMPTHP